jgi:hypothetical protein
VNSTVHSGEQLVAPQPAASNARSEVPVPTKMRPPPTAIATMFGERASG